MGDPIYCFANMNRGFGRDVESKLLKMSARQGQLVLNAEPLVALLNLSGIYARGSQRSFPYGLDTRG